MICDQEAKDDYLLGDDMSGYGLYIIEAKDGPFYSYAQMITDFRPEFKVLAKVEPGWREGFEQGWKEADEADRPYH